MLELSSVTALAGKWPPSSTSKNPWKLLDTPVILIPLTPVRDGHCPEYSGEEQAIFVVGMVKAKPCVFIGAIQYLLVLATRVEVVNFPYLLVLFFLHFSWNIVFIGGPVIR
ncbi:unnamed protein product [Fraxinus pennsylvanica]|uniref:Uncharacterized protein n=1 Tax=Fraxinus pennsylvanica TaxID=56036 RepID=A0AAD1ZKT8_9LAMI|nr:unnamed protein product [Fraxinus pennsylvanica]